MFRKNQNVWHPKGGEFEIQSQLVEIEEIAGPTRSEPSPPRPQSGNPEAEAAVHSISLDFIVGKPMSEAKLRHLESVLPEQPVEEWTLPDQA